MGGGGGKGGGGGGGEQNSRTTVTSEPWQPAQKHLKFGMDWARNLFDNNELTFPDQTFADPSQQTNLAFSNLENLANQGSAVGQSSRGLFADTLAGKFLGPNEFMDDNYDKAANAVRRNYTDLVEGNDAAFSQAGRFGGRMHNEEQREARQDFGETLGDLSSQMYGANYANERQNMQKILSAAPMMSGFEMTDIDRLGQVGGFQDTLNQRQVDEDVARHNFNQQEPFNALSRYMGTVIPISSGFGSQTTNSSGSSGVNNDQGFGFSGQGALGGALSGGSFGPWGAIGGGLLGGFL